MTKLYIKIVNRILKVLNIIKRPVTVPFLQFEICDIDVQFYIILYYRIVGNKLYHKTIF